MPLSLLGILSSIKQAKQIHAHMITNSLLSSPPTISKLIKQYVSVGRPGDSLKLFARSIHPDKYSFIYVLSACAKLRALREGMQAHDRVIKSGFFPEKAIQTTAIHFYANCRDLISARNVFDEMPIRSSITWNALLTAYCTNGAAKEMFALLYEMCDQCARPTARTAVTLLSACAQLKDLALGRSIHAYIHKFASIHGDYYIGTALVDMYSKCGSLDNALKLFDGMWDRNVYTWTAMVAGYAMHGKGKEALNMMDRMMGEGIQPNELTFTCVLSACCHSGLLKEGMQVFNEMKKRFGVEPGVHHYACVVDLLGRAGLVEEARGVIRKMPIKPDLVVWRALLSACKMHGRVEMGEEIGRWLLRMEKAAKRGGEGKSCEDFVALSNVYAAAERWEDVEMVRGMMRGLRVLNNAGRSSVQSV